MLTPERLLAMRETYRAFPPDARLLLAEVDRLKRENAIIAAERSVLGSCLHTMCFRLKNMFSHELRRYEPLVKLCRSIERDVDEAYRVMGAIAERVNRERAA